MSSVYRRTAAAFAAVVASSFLLTAPSAPAVAREVVAFNGGVAPGTIVVRTSERKLYLVLGEGRAACDRLVVGLNTDASVRRLKGAHRPVQDEAARAAVLASLRSVDLVVPFTEDTPMALIEAMRPDLLIKGADYSRERVVGAAFVESYGGRVMLVPLVPGNSTTGTIARIGASAAAKGGG